MSSPVLAINAGSSSVKFALFDCSPGERPVLIVRGAVEDTDDEPSLTLKHASRAEAETIKLGPTDDSGEGLFAALIETIEDRFESGKLAAVGHRIVHGGPQFGAPVIIDAEVLPLIEALTPLAPLHQLRCIQPIHAIRSLRSNLIQVACFDTAFHRSLSPPASRYAIPRAFEAQGIRKFGFHGLSYEYVAERLVEISPALAAGRTVVAHLGNGASLCAMRNGRSVDTTMGLSVLDGLVMGTRCGALDPGVILHLQEAHGLRADEVADILYHRSGLLGVSEISSDMRELLASSDPRAREAVELFAFRAAQEVATMAHTLEGLDALVFTGGIGENAPEIRTAICDRLHWLGVKLNPTRNNAVAEDIAAPDSRVAILVVRTDEELVIARHLSKMSLWDDR